MTCLEPKSRIVVQCKNIFNILNECGMSQTKFGNYETLANNHDKNETQSDNGEELIQVENDEIC